jgi:hypothetical protein
MGRMLDMVLCRAGGGYSSNLQHRLRIVDAADVELRPVEQGTGHIAINRRPHPEYASPTSKRSAHQEV